MITELPLDSIVTGSYNSRVRYNFQSINKLAKSMQMRGQLSAVRVRQSSEAGKYELIFGHRRVMAARKLGWSRIKAEVVRAENDEAVEVSLLENLQREDLTDYEKAMVFDRLNREFNKTYEEIGEFAGMSRQTVSNHIAMLRLFDAETLARDPELLDALYHLNEHHSRVLARVRDSDTRRQLVLRTVKEQLSVRDLSHLIGRLRSWFSEESQQEQEKVAKHPEANMSKEIEEITRIIMSEFELPKEKDFPSFKDIHLFSNGFSMYRAFPPLQRLDHTSAFEREREWFYNIAPSFLCDVRDLKVDMLGDATVATLSVCFRENRKGGQKVKLRGTMVLTRRSGVWKIFHEHW